MTASMGINASMTRARHTAAAAGLTLLAVVAWFYTGNQPAGQTYIVQGKSTEAVEAAVRSVGGSITHELNIIRAVGALLHAV